MNGLLKLRILNCLFLCTGNSCRSIIAESIMNKIGKDIFRGYSAGSSPVGFVNPMSILMLESKGHDVSCLSSKSWDQYASAPHMDFIITEALIFLFLGPSLLTSGEICLVL